MRCSEFSADRAATMEQAIEYKNLVNSDAWNKTLEILMFRNEGHPLNVIRAFEGKEWEKMKDVRILLNMSIQNNLIKTLGLQKNPK